MWVSWQTHPIDKSAEAALFVEQPSVTDAFPPYSWEGTTAFKDWMADAVTYCTKHEDTDVKLILGKSLYQEVDGDHGNVILPLVWDFKEGGKPVRVKGLANVVLLKNRETWKHLSVYFHSKVDTVKARRGGEYS